MKLAIGLLAFCLVSIAPTGAGAQDRRSKCNELPYAQCVACAKSRGFKPAQYEPYCRR